MGSRGPTAHRYRSHRGDSRGDRSACHRRIRVKDELTNYDYAGAGCERLDVEHNGVRRPVSGRSGRGVDWPLEDASSAWRKSGLGIDTIDPCIHCRAWRWASDGVERSQASMWVATQDLPRSAAHPFYRA